MEDHADTRSPAAASSVDRLLFESSPDCVKVLDLEGRLLEMNRNGQCVMEIADFDVVAGKPWPTLWPDASRPQVAGSLEAARGGNVVRFQAFCPTALGTPKWWDVTVTPVLDAAGVPVSLLSVSRDITDLHDAQEEQRETAAHLRFILESSNIGAWELDLRTGLARTSLLHDRCFGYESPVTEWSYERFMSHVHPDDRETVDASFLEAMTRHTDWYFECRVIWADASEHWVSARGSFYRGPDGECTRILGAVTDITRRKADEAALRDTGRHALENARRAEAERLRLDALLQAAPISIMYVGPDGQLLTSNPASHRLWGAHPSPAGVHEYAPWKGWWADNSDRHGQALAPEDWPVARLLAGLATGTQCDLVEIEPFDAPGTRKTTLMQTALVRDGEGGLVGAVVVQQDITEQVRAEAALRESQARLMTITDAVPQMIWSTLPDGSSDYFNRQWYTFTGSDEGASNGWSWTELVHPDDRAGAAEAWKASSATGQAYDFEYRLRHHSGSYRWVLARGLPVRAADGRIERWMGSCTDVHERKTFESALERSENALRQADRRKDEFLAMLAHELRNPLAPISTAAQLLHRAADDPVRVRRAGDIIDRQVRHMTELVDDLLDVSRVTRGLVELQRESLDLKSVVAAAVEQARPLIEARGHVLRTSTMAASVPVEGDWTRLVQVVVNLLNNAAKYTPHGGTIDLRVGVRDGEACVHVQDNGIGIDAALLPGVFELFTQGERTPDRAQGGLGIGLALVRSIAQLHGGRVAAQSAGTNAGSTFSVWLPLSVAPDARRPDARGAAPAVAKGASLRVLAVDDNVDAGAMLGELLQMEGHHVTVVDGARAALAQVQQGGVFDVYVLDIGLPEMNGYDLATRIRETAAGQGALFIALTGYGQAHDRVLSKAAGFDYHLVKPVDTDRLLTLLRSAAGAVASRSHAAS